MRLVLPCLLSVVFATGLAPSIVHTSPADTPIMPLSEVKPGMKGYGLSVFSGQVPERFDFTVRGIVPDFELGEDEVWPWAISVQLSGGPKRPDGSALFDKNLVYSGMSGSPLFIDGRLIGGLMGGLVSPKEFSTAAQAFVTPIELQLGLTILQREHEKPTGPITVQPGAYVGVCFVYGDSDRCIQSTVTAEHDRYLLTTSHSVGLPFGTIALPVFELPVADLVESERVASKLSGKRGLPIGTAVAHGMFGMVVREGALPITVPVRLTVDGVFEKPLALKYNMAYHKNATGSLRATMKTAIAQLPIKLRTAGLQVRIRLANPAGTILFSEGLESALTSLENILDHLIDQEQAELRIDGIDVEYMRMPEPDLWTPLAIDIENNKDVGRVTILARRSRDNTLEQISATVDTRPLQSLKETKLQWMDGTSLQKEILKTVPIRSAFALFSQIQNRSALYGVSIESDDEIAIERDAVTGVNRREPGIRILLRPDTGHRRFRTMTNRTIHSSG